jgi:superfamily I DNA/RNA helicase
LLPPPAPALGKNRVPTIRFAHILLTKWASPNRLLAFNFPNNAARKKPRIVAAILGESAKGL